MSGNGRATADLVAEKALLGAMIYDNDRIADVAAVLPEPKMFSATPHRAIYSVLLELYSKGEIADLPTVKAELERRGLLSSIAGERKDAAVFLLDLVESFPSAEAARQYAEIVRQKYVIRSIDEACRSVVSLVAEGGKDAEDVRQEAERVLFEAVTKGERRKVESLSDILHRVFKGIDDLQNRKGHLTGIPTGFYDLDDMTSGLQDGQLVVVAGRPSMGKTSFALNVAENVAFREQKGVLIFSLEMSAQQVATALLCSHARVDSSLMRKGRISEEDYQKLVLAAGAYGECKILVDDAADLSVLDLRTRARRIKAVENISLVIVDYLQKLSAKPAGGRGPESRQIEISAISSNLKSLAKELSVPVIAVAQLNRSPEGREDKRPLLSDLRESGAIEQDADLVIMLYREEYYRTEAERKGVAELDVAKNRTGPTGKVELAFLKQFTRFENLSHL